MSRGLSGSLRVREITRTAGVVLLVLEHSTCRSGKTGALLHLYADLAPLAVVACGADAILAFDMEARPVEAGALRNRFPDLDAMLEPFLDASQRALLMNWR